MGNYSEAVTVCEGEIEKNQNNIDSYVVMCWALVANKQYSESEIWAAKAISISPYDQRVIEVLAEAKYFQGKNDEALSLFQNYIGIVQTGGSRSGDVYYYMGEIYIRKGKFQHADIAFSQAVKTEPLNDIWWTRLGYAREMTKNYRLAALAYERALTINAQNSEAKKGLARVTDRI
ncbi:MAG: tetratricopeptide repeat protein [Treponemataceae bacterium]